MSQYVVITTINPPTKAVQQFAAISGWQLVCVGDRKSPTGWSHPGVDYLSAEAQAHSGFRLAEKLPWNHYVRKMMGYLHAMRQGADVIVDTDDDNIPYDGWDVLPFEAAYETTARDRGFVNIYRSYTDMHIWPRGFPLNQITDPGTILTDGDLTRRDVKIGVWQGLADLDPDVDAIYRLVSNEPCTFAKRAPIVLDEGTWCPYNSQNTAYRRELVALLYLPAHVTFRFTDILRSFVAQPILWALGYRLGFTEATVYQERNPHNYLHDFESEIPCYLHTDKATNAVLSAVSADKSLADNLYDAYEHLLSAGVVVPAELETLRAWLDDCRALNYL